MGTTVTTMDPKVAKVATMESKMAPKSPPKVSQVTPKSNLESGLTAKLAPKTPPRDLQRVTL